MTEKIPHYRYEGFNLDFANALMEATNNTLKFNMEIWPNYNSAIGTDSTHQNKFDKIFIK